MRRKKEFVRGLAIGLSVFICLITGVLANASESQAAYSILHTFGGGPSTDGAFPMGDITLSGTTLYGMTKFGGLYASGAIFKMNPDGSEDWLYSFGTVANDGLVTYGSLTLSADGSTLYGMTLDGGDNQVGAIFSINTNGTNYHVMHSFGDVQNDGAYPWGSLTLSGSTLYGVTSSGGGPNGSGFGTIFSINTNGSGYQPNLHSFSGGADGAGPSCSLTLSGSTLYGTTSGGGDNDYGTLFKINTNGSGYLKLFSFGGANDGTDPCGAMVLSGSTLYGMTTYTYGGGIGNGVIFKINTSGIGYRVLHSFSGGAGDGANPGGSLTLLGPTLFGMTASGGAYGFGTVFSINTNGGAYQPLVHSFGAGSDGASPNGSLTLLGSTLLGMTAGGGSTTYGTVFSLPVATHNGLVVNLGASGLWYYRSGAWRNLTSLAPLKMAPIESDMVALFQGAGLYQYTGSAWKQLTPISNIDLIAGVTDRVYVDFPGAGLWQYNGAWTRITALNPNHMLAFGNNLLANFPGAGLYQYDGASWTQLTPLSTADSMVAGASAVYVHFPSAGLYAYSSGAWTGLTPLSPTMMQAYGNSLAANFTGSGLYSWSGSSWTPLTPLAAKGLMGASNDLYVDFGTSGLFQYNGANWYQITPFSPNLMGSMDASLIANFSGMGLYAYDGSVWSKLTPLNSATAMLEVSWP